LGTSYLLFTTGDFAKAALSHQHERDHHCDGQGAASNGKGNKDSLYEHSQNDSEDLRHHQLVSGDWRSIALNSLIPPALRN
jgi:hypothetical protein